MKQNAHVIRLLLYALIFLCFAGMFFFIVPQSDVLLFAHDGGSDAFGALETAFTYGNGRLLGNWVGMFFAHHFLWAFLPLAGCLTGIVWLVDRLVFGGSAKAVLPTALLVAFPSARMAEESYFLFAAFANYVLPVFGILLAVYLTRVLSRRHKPRILHAPLYLLLFLCAALSALCSENTTIVLLTLAVLAVISDARRERHLTARGIVFLLGAAVGALCMYRIPIWSESAYKMDAYRDDLFGSVSGLLHGAVSAFAQFAGIAQSFTLVMILLSAVMLQTLRGKGSRASYVFARAVLTVCPLFSLVMTAMNGSFEYAGVTQFVFVIPTVLYAAAVCIGVSALPKADKTRAHGFMILLLMSVAPMMAVDKHGSRTYYLTFMLLLVWTLELLRSQKNTWTPVLRRLHLGTVPCTAAFVCGMVILSAFCGVQTMLNFDVFAVRTEKIAQALEQGQPEITVPFLPNCTVSVEDNWYGKISDILPDKSALQITESADVSVCDGAEAYEALYHGSPLYPVRYAFGHLPYKNPANVHAVFSASP